MYANFKQLFNIIDGRLSTNMDDVYGLLNHIVDEELMTHHLGTAMAFIKERARPDWYVQLEGELNEIKAKVGDDFNTLMDYIDNHYNDKTYPVPKLTDEQKDGFEDYMLNNSLLLNLKE